MAFYQLKKKQLLKADLHTVWQFIASPENLKIITPPYMGFDITTDADHSKMYAGMIISYKVSPLLGIKTDWVTEITYVVEGKYFVDEQRIGPYKLWHHQHILEETTDGVQMIDIVTYAPPLGYVGALMNHWVIKHKLKEIFDYRHDKLEMLFNKS